MRQLLLRCAFHIALVVGVWQTSAAQAPYVLDTLYAGEGASRPVTVIPTRAGALFILERSGQMVRVLEPNGGLRLFLKNQDPLRTQEHFAALALHPLYPDSPLVYVLVTHPSRPAVLVCYRDSAYTAISPQILWSAEEPGTAAGTMHTGPDNTLMILLREGSDPRAPTLGRSTHVVYFPLASEDADDAEVMEIDDHDIVDALYDPSARLFYCIERPDADPRSERSFVVHDDEDLDSPIRQSVPQSGNGRPVAMNTLAFYQGDAFPRLAGSLLVTGRRTTALWGYRPFSPAGADTAFSILSHGFGFSCVDAGATGFLFAVSGPYDTAVVLRVRPTIPRFISAPPESAWENRSYEYTPLLEGTPPSLTLVNAPPGMTLDTMAWTIRWTPTQEDVHRRAQKTLLVARNGAGTAEQEIAPLMININDPPAPFELGAPDEQASLQFVETDPIVEFTWRRAADPDGDPVHYLLQLDTLPDFTSAPPLRSVAGDGESMRVGLPLRDGVYYWRVLAADGALTTVSQPPARMLRVSVVRPEKEKKERRAEPQPTEPVLEQNFPNPFNPTTSIKYTIPQSGRVRLSVFNLLGQELAVIFEGNQSEGTHEVDFSLASLPSGIYFYRIQAPGLVETKKMVVTR